LSWLEQRSAPLEYLLIVRQKQAQVEFPLGSPFEDDTCVIWERG